MRETIKTIFNKNKKTKETIKLKEKKQYESFRRKTVIRKQNESNKEIKQSERYRNRKKATQEEDIDIGRLFELTTSNKIYVNRLQFYEIENEILLEYTGDFETIGSMLIGEMGQKTNIRFENVDDFETSIVAIDVDYGSDYVVFTKFLYKINTPDFNRVL